MMILYICNQQNANLKGGVDMFPNLQAEQARKGMTNQQVAEQLGITRSTYEAKKKSGRFVAKECSNLCKIFQSSFEYLFYCEPTQSA